MRTIRNLFQSEAAGGIVLMLATVLAMICANSSLGKLYGDLLAVSAEIRVGQLALSKPLLLWINDGLMAIFFLLVGLEVKREILQGQLSKASQIALPGIAAAGGMLVPALVYVAINGENPDALKGWAIPAATDIAFALGVLALVAKGLPVGLRLFLLTVAIFDDLGAILIIAIFYTSDLSLLSLVQAGVTLGVLILLNRSGVTHVAAYCLVGILLWVFVLKSGVHATIAGVFLAFAIPLRKTNPDGVSPLHRLEHQLHPWVAFGILPLFAFANTGIALDGLSLRLLTNSIPLGIALGLFLGKQLGIFGFSWLAIRLGWAQLPEQVSWKQLYGVAALCGIGFTMSLFIASLAFEHGGPNYLALDRLGILAGSILSGILGYLVLRRRDRPTAPVICQ